MTHPGVFDFEPNHNAPREKLLPRLVFFPSGAALFVRVEAPRLQETLHIAE
jgi:hypothetical protein